MVADDVVFIHNDHEPAVIWKGEIGAVLRRPPHIAARQFFSGPMLNSLRCQVSNGALQLAKDLGSLGRTDAGIELADGFVLFEPNQVIWDTGGTQVRWAANSGSFTFCEISVGKEIVRIVGLRAPEPLPHSFSLTGPVELFSSTGKFIESIVIESTLCAEERPLKKS